MAVTLVNEIWQGRNGSSDREGIRTYTHIYRVKTDSNYDDATTVTTSGSTPIVGNVHPSDTGAWCQKVTATNEPFAPRVWLVTCSYSSQQELADDPTDDPTDFSWSTEQFQKPAYIDRNGYGIVNSAGDSFDPPPDRDDSRIKVVVKKNFATIPTWILGVHDHLNSEVTTIDAVPVAIEAAKIQSVQVSNEQERNSITFRSLTMELQVNVTETWQLRLLDQGFRRKGNKNESQRIELTGGPDEGWFTLTYDGQTTAQIAFDAAALLVQTRLEALSNIAVGDVSVTGLSGGPWVVEFIGSLAGINVVEMTYAHGLGGGTNPDVDITTLRQGAAGSEVATNRYNIKNADSSDITSPALLDGSGQPLANPGFSNAVFMGFDIYQTFDFNSTLPFLA